MNVAPNQGRLAAPDPEILKGYGINAVRIVSRPPVDDAARDVETYAARCQAAGLFVLGVITTDSGREGQEYVIQHADAIQFGNEPDGIGEASWKMTGDEYVARWMDFRTRHSNLKLIAAGMTYANQNTFKWKEVAPKLLGVDGIDRHLYRKGSPNVLLGVLTDFADVRLNDLQGNQKEDVPLWVTEWHPDPTEFKYIPGMSAMFAEVAVGDFFYCWSNLQTDATADRPARGLFLSDGQTPREEFLHYMQAQCMPTFNHRAHAGVRLARQS